MRHSAVSVQLYSVRDALASDPRGTLLALHDLGFRHVEPFGLPANAAALAQVLAETGMSAPTVHADVLARTEASFEAANRIGASLIIEPYQDPARFASRSELERLATELNAAADLAAAEGVRVGYHNHDGELRQTIDGVPALLLLAELTHEQVGFELDAYWSAVAGVNPVDVAHALGDRLLAVHVKDGDPNAGVNQQVAAGDGTVPLAAVLMAAPTALAVVEFDVLPAAGFNAIARSLAFIESMAGSR